MKRFDLWKRIEESGFQGIDVDPEISLMEYNFIALDNPLEKELFIYIINYRKRLDYGWFSYQDIDSVIDESWFDSKSFFDYLGTNKEDWLQLPYITKVGDLFWYHSPANYGFSMYGELSFLNFARNFKNNTEA